MSDKDDTIKQITNLMRTDDSVDAPADAILWSKNIFRTRRTEPRRSAVERILAVLRADLAPGRAVFGERSGSSSAARQMLFEAGETGIDLRIAETGEGFEVRGQILGEGFGGAAVRFGRLETTADELGQFGFEGVPAGRSDLSVRTADREIVIEEIELG